MVSGETARITRSKSARKATTNRPPRDAARRTTGVRKAKAPARRVKKETQKIVSESDGANLGTVHVPRRSTIAIRSMPPKSVTPHGSYNSKSGAAEVDLRAILFGRRGNQAVEGGTKSHQLEVGVVEEDSDEQGEFEVEEDDDEQDQLGGGGSSGFQALLPPERKQFVKILTSTFHSAALDIVVTYDEMLDGIKAAFEEEKLRS
ncbi:hypothetical protein CC1G_13120 [Coprinopsis cinerea okayama7|uniref:Uncharacterized protein n=1 Tax=Coprinopsis cinerea (strain Okayama-7 / 130 / ATCC MYA-4618 / FGSC 9003) TaxID=240176 RepID=A8PAW2_COPC7|nr:hypothetical protein CC1G_13120 [Coprinopsis cinerea okayama7\|eukprot:XP_001840062.2 hypothetical protein CC1G_13120 [Coprinopsis cinerea okayama7\